MPDPIEKEEFERRFGTWEAFTPAEAKAVLDPLGLAWWVVGGQAIEAFTGVVRPHDDLDVGMWLDDVSALVTGLNGRFHVWAAGLGAQLRALAPTDSVMPEWAHQVWLRKNAQSPWRVDVLLNPRRDGRWVNRREPELAPLSVEDITFMKDGIRWQKPEFVLAFKAKHSRPKDDADFEATLGHLDAGARAHLAAYLERQHPEHPWRRRL